MLTQSQIDKAVIIKQQLTEAWQTTFPLSTCTAYNISRDGMSFMNGYLFANIDEWPHGISRNDPLQYSGHYDAETDTYKETACSLYVKPSPGSYLAMERIKLRLQSIKQPTPAKLLKRFEAIKSLCSQNVSLTFYPELIASKL